MKDIIIIGRSRTGKTTLSNKIIKRFKFQLINTDAIRDTLKIVFPELGIGPDTGVTNKRFQDFLKQYLENFKMELRDEYGLVMEGVETSAITAKKLYGNKEKYIIYALGQIKATPEEMKNNLIKYDTKYDWTYEMKKDKLEFCNEEREKAIALKKECDSLKIPFYDTSINREEVLNQILVDIEKNLK